MEIERFNTPWFMVGSGFAVDRVTRRGSLVEMDAVNAFPLEGLLIEFASPERAEEFVECVTARRARIEIEEDEERGRVTRNAAGVVRLAIMHDTGVTAAGFDVESVAALKAWMLAHGFSDDTEPESFPFVEA